MDILGLENFELGNGNYLIESYYGDQQGNKIDRQNGEIVINDNKISTIGEIDQNVHGCGGISTKMYCSHYEKLSGDLRFDDNGQLYFYLTINEVDRNQDGSIIAGNKTLTILKYDSQDADGHIIFSEQYENEQTFYLKINNKCNCSS